jgi:hypothetical protein
MKDKKLIVEIQKLNAKLDIIIDYVQEIQKKESVRLIKG